MSTGAKTLETQVRASDIALQMRELSKKIGGQEVLKSLTMEIKRGELFGIIGPDGSGKSTLIKILAGLIRHDSGFLSVLGKSALSARKEIGYVTQQFSLYPDLSVDENLRYIAGIHDVPKAHFSERKHRLLERTGLARFEGRLASQLSGGMKQKLSLCCALISQPELLLLDEPTAGVDPLFRQELWSLLVELAQSGVTIVSSTAYYEEADRCSRVALLSEGAIYACGKPAELKKELQLSRIELYTDDNRQAERVLAEQQQKGLADIVDIHAFGDHLELLLSKRKTDRDRIIEIIRENQIVIRQLKTCRPLMEDVFVSRAGKASDFKLNVRQFGKQSPDPESKRGAAIEAKQLGKRFGSFTAVADLNLQISFGEIYCLLGANGAGKTTTIKLLCGLQKASSGAVQLAGQKAEARSSGLRKRIGYMSQKSTLYADLTVIENLEFYSAVYEIPFDDRKAVIETVLRGCGLFERRQALIANLPRGVKQRVAFAAAVLHAPEILFLDEPSAGVDPLARRQIWQMIRGLAENGTAILVTTHNLEEAQYCNRLGIMAASRLLVEGTAAELKSAGGSKSLEEAFIKLVQERGAQK